MSEQSLQEQSTAFAFELLAVPFEQRGRIVARTFAGRDDFENIVKITGVTLATLCVMVDAFRNAEGGEEVMTQITNAINVQTLISSLDI